MSSYLSYESNHALHALTTSLEAKSSKMWKFHLLVKTVIWAQNWILIVKMNPRVYSVFKIEPWRHINWNCTQNSVIMITLKNMLYNYSSFKKIWDCHWVHGIETSPGVVSVSNFESRLIMHVKRDKFSLTINLVKCNFWNVT